MRSIKVVAMIIALLGASMLSAQASDALQTQQRQSQGGRAQQPELRSGTSRETGRARSQARLVEDVRRRLVTLPYYDVFDWLEFKLSEDGTAVTLLGQVVRPTTKSDAEARVKDIEGVERVINQIEVLPLSPNDDRVRIALYRAIYNYDSPLFRYATRTVPPIHIIVRNGRATLKGVVATETDSQLANVAARGVPGVFEVTNELRVEKREAR